MKKITLIITITLQFYYGMAQVTLGSQTPAFQQEILFIENKGQILNISGKPEDEALFICRYSNKNIYIYRNRIVIVDIYCKHDPDKKTKILYGTDIKTITNEYEFLNSNKTPSFRKEMKTNYYENYYLAHCEISDVPSFKKVIIEDIFPGVSLLLETKSCGIIPKFISNMNANSEIEIKKTQTIAENDSVIFSSSESFSILLNNTKDSTIIIPELSDEFVFDINVNTVDEPVGFVLGDSGSVYVYGGTMASSGIGTSGTHQMYNNSPGYYDSFIIKYDQSYSKVWGTYYGGGANDVIAKMLINSANELVLVGSTESGSGIPSSDAYHYYPSLTMSMDGFLARFNLNGNRIYGTFVYEGAIDDATIDNSDTLIVAGHFERFFVSKTNYLGMPSWTYNYNISQSYSYFEINSIKTDDVGNIYACGSTNSDSSISTPSSYMPIKPNTIPNYPSSFLSKFNASGSVVWSTYFGSVISSSGRDILINNNNIFLIGQENGGDAFNNQFSTQYGYFDVYITKFNDSGIPVYGKYFGGTSSDKVSEALFDMNGNIILRGSTTSTDSIASLYAYHSFYSAVYNSYLASFTPNLDERWSTYTHSYIDFDINSTNDIICMGRNYYQIDSVTYEDTCFFHIFNEQDITPVNTNQFYKSVNVFPNPFINYFTINIMPESESSEIFVYSCDGKLLNKISTSNSSFTIDASKYEVGLYLVKIKQGKCNDNFKIIKLCNNHEQ